MTFTGWKTRLNPLGPQIKYVVDPNVDAKLTCLAIIDESSSGAYSIPSSWITFRERWPLRRFFLATPYPEAGGAYNMNTQNPNGGYIAGSNGGVTIPSGFDSYALADTERYQVSRDLRNRSYASDWFDMIRIDDPDVEVKVVLLFIDVSGSMVSETVVESTMKFVKKMSDAGYRYKTVYNGDEEYVLPFFATLNDFGTL